MIKARIKRNAYFDSITLMKVARFLTDLPGIEDAAAIMATEPNKQLLAEAGLTPFEGVAGPGDVLLVVRADNEESARTALQTAEEQLTRRPARGAASADEANVPRQPRSLEQAVQMHSDTRLAVISVPGPYAALESERALRAGLHVFLFSDNVPLDAEIALKQLARERGLLLMGPDCGTAMLNGVGLGFVNVVPRGSIGIVGASGTGIQEVMSLIAQHGHGISQIIGCGGRDLSEAVGAITTIQGIRLLQADAQTEVLVLISKPPAPTVAERVLEVATEGDKPVVVMFVGADHDALQRRYGERVVVVRTLTEAARRAVALQQRQEAQAPVVPLPTMPDTMVPVVMNPAALDPTVVHDVLMVAMPLGEARTPEAPEIEEDVRERRLVGLFSGGTLCDETMHIWSDRLGPVYSNIPLDPAWKLREGERAQGHSAIDFGADEYTRGRPHPMIDPALRLKRFEAEARDPQVTAILLDIVLGYCAHPNPADVYGPAIASALEGAATENRLLDCVVALCGTEDDPQRLSAQMAALREAGAEVFTSNADAAQRCIEFVA